MKNLERVPGEFEDARLIEDIVITAPGHRPVYVRDVATVDFGFKERDSYARLDGRSVVTLGVSKRVGKNIIQTADAVKAVIEESIERGKDQVLFHEANSCPEFWEQTRIVGGVNVAESLLRCAQSLLGT